MRLSTYTKQESLDDLISKDKDALERLSLHSSITYENQQSILSKLIPLVNPINYISKIKLPSLSDVLLIFTT